MSNEHTHEPNRHNRRHNDGKRPIWYHEANVGPPDMKLYTVAKFFISATDESPEIYLALVPREPVFKEDGSVAMKVVYHGDIKKNAVPINMIDMESLWNVLVEMKAKNETLKNQYVQAPKPKEPERVPTKSPPDQPAHLAGRVRAPARVIARIIEALPTKEEPVAKVDLAKALPGW